VTIQSLFHARSTALEVVHGHDLSGKTVLITGASSGIGVETARVLVHAGAEVILAVRDASKGAAVAQALRESTGNVRVHVLLLDLRSFASIRQAATQFAQQWPKLDILINNANAVHPGGILNTGLQKYLTMEEQRALGWYDAEGNPNPLAKTVEQGAATSVWAAVGPELAGTGGLYLEDCHEAEIISPENANTANRYVGYMPYARSPESAERLWCVTQEMIGE